MSVTLTTPQNIPNITRWQAVVADLASGRVVLRFATAGSRSVDRECVLSDVVSGCIGVIVNPSPVRFDDQIITANGRGAVNSLTNAIAAYRGAGSHAAGLKALELQGVTDGWVDAAFAGT